MAYDYIWNDDEIDFRVNYTPGVTTVLTPGDTVTLTGKIKPKKYAIKGIILYFNVDNDKPDVSKEVKLAVAKGATGSFTAKVTLTQALWQLAVEYRYGLNVHFNFGGFSVIKSGSEPLFVYEMGSWKIQTAQPVAPVINTSSANCWGDANETASAWNLASAFAAHYSIPKFTVKYTTDSNYPNITTEHHLVLSGTMQEDVDINSAAGNAEWTQVFDAKPLLSSGSVNWSYTISDSFGNSSSMNGTFNILDYNSPTISKFICSRWATHINERGESKEEYDPLGQNVWFDLSSTMYSLNGHNSILISVTSWQDGSPEDTNTYWTKTVQASSGNTTTYQTTEEKIQTLVDGVYDDVEYDAGTRWCFRVVVVDALGSTIEYTDDKNVVEATSIFNIEETGVSIGKLSSGTTTTPLFECAYPSIFESDVAVGANALIKVLTVSSTGSVSVSNPDLNYSILLNPGAGWTPVCVGGYRASNAALHPSEVKVTDGALNVSARYYGSRTTAFTARVTVDILCLRTSLN